MWSYGFVTLRKDAETSMKAAREAFIDDQASYGNTLPDDFHIVANAVENKFLSILRRNEMDETTYNVVFDSNGDVSITPVE